MAKVLQASGGLYANSASTDYLWVGNTLCASPFAAEAQTQITYRSAGTSSNLFANVFSNSGDTATTIRVRVNGSNGNQVLSIGAAATGEFEDTSNTDTISDGDEVNLQAVIGGTSVPQMRILATLFAASSNTVIRHAAAENFSFSTASTTFYRELGGRGSGSNQTTTEALAQSDFNSAGTLRDGFAYVNSNGRSTNGTLGSRINGANGNISFSITGSTTGIFEDTSNTDSISVNDDVNYYFTTGSGSGTTNFRSMSVEFETTNAKFHSISSEVNSGGTTGKNQIRAFPVGGYLNPEISESDYALPMGIAATASNLFCYVQSNSINASSVFTLRRDQTATNVTLSIGSNATGQFEDTTNTDTFTANQDVNYEMLGGGGTGGGTTIRLSIAGCMFENTETGGIEVSRRSDLNLLGVGN